MTVQLCQEGKLVDYAYKDVVGSLQMILPIAIKYDGHSNNNTDSDSQHCLTLFTRQRH